MLKGSTRATFDSCTFLRNRADWSRAGAIFADDKASVMVTNSTFFKNVAVCVQF